MTYNFQQRLLDQAADRRLHLWRGVHAWTPLTILMAVFSVKEPRSTAGAPIANIRDYLGLFRLRSVRTAR